MAGYARIVDALQIVILCISVSLSIQACISPTNRCDCFTEGNHSIVNCRFKSLTSIPPFTTTNILYDEIRFGGNSISQIGATDFANIKVRSIDLLENKITNIAITAFINLTSYLEALYLEGNGVVDFPHTAVSPLEKLKTLHLENYGTAVINASTPIPLPNLERLELKAWPQLQRIEPDGFRVIDKLSELSLENMRSLSELPIQAIQTYLYKNLSKLEIIDTNIARLQGEIFKPLSKLEEVSITRNSYLTSIDNAAFSGVSDTIKILDLDTNRISQLTFLKMLNWTVISHLNIGYNYQLNTIPSGTFSTMPTLDYLQCQDCGLSSVDESMFRGLQSLHTLDLGFNAIKTVQTEAFKNSPYLTELRLNHQSAPPIVFNSGAFNGIETSLEILNLESNSFNLVQFWQDVKKFNNLKVLELKSTNISNIPDKAFSNNTKLESLFLSDNTISSLKQETFFGPRGTLRTIDLQFNNINTVPVCTLYDFSKKPTMKLANNPLHCDCNLKWLYDWVHVQDNPLLAALDIGQCSTPTALQNKTFDQFSASELCTQSIPLVNCSDLYATTTTSTTTSTSTTTTTTSPSTVPMPAFDLLIANEYVTSIEVTWNILDKTYLTGLKLEMRSNTAQAETRYPGVEEKSLTFYNLQSDSYYTFCLTLKINNVYREEGRICKNGQTKPPDYTTKPSQTTESTSGESKSQLGMIIGASVGGLVLIGLIIAILVVILRSNKPKQKPMTEPVSFTLRADIPHTGGTAKRFQKKADKGGATPDDINITVISNGDMANRDRLSAGSYQALNEKGVDLRPMPSTSHGYYTNSVEDRPLPKTPNGAMDWKSRAMGHGYVNTGGATNQPETSKNEYSEVRY